MNGKNLCCGAYTSFESTNFSAGRIVRSGNSYTVQYHITDHLGSVRVVLNQSMTVLEQNDYYPFGLRHPNTSLKTTSNRYRYNGKEEIAAVATSDYGARQYSAEFCQWMQADPHSESYYNTSSYVYCHNNPILLFDKNGMDDYYDMNGNLIKHRDNDSNVKFVIQNKKEVRALKKTIKSGGDIDYGSLTSATELPSDATLQESLNVLDRTIANGGLREESSIVMNDGTVIQGQTGSMPTIVNGEQVASATLPNLPAGTTPTDAEATIHSHPTTVQQVGSMIYPQQADLPSQTDKGTFSQYNRNIIVGPLGTVNLNNVTTNPNGTFNVPNRPNGAVIYDRNTNRILRLERNAIQNILKN